MAIVDLGAKFEFEDAGAAERAEKLINAISGLTDRVSGLENVVTGTSKEMGVLSGTLNETTKSFNAFVTAQTQNVRKMGGVVDEVENTRKSIDRLGAQANRFVSSNIMAQFQDVFISAQMGMRPFTIAMQQGTQLMTAFAQSKAPLKDLVAGFKALISPATFLTVALTGLVAVIVQSVDWSNLLGKTIEGLGSLLGSSKIMRWGQSFKDLSKDIKAAEEAAKGLSKGINVLNEFETKVADEEFDLSLHGKSNTEIAFLKARREGENAINKILKENNDLTASDMEYLNDGVKLYAEKMKKIAGIKEANEKYNESLKKTQQQEERLKLVTENLTKSYEKILNVSEKKIDDAKFQSSLLGMSEYEKEFAQTYRDLTEQVENLKSAAIAEGVDTSFFDGYEEKLEDLAKRTAKVTEETNKLTEAYTESKSIFKGFFSDMRQGLLEGESAWESFGNAVLNVLNKIQEKLMDKTTDLLFDALWNVGSAYFSAPSTTGGSTAEVNRLGDLGASVGRKPMVAAANGGVFSNGIYDSPTLFKFARGGRFGVMGEAGPEAVMPLTRGPDGSLGVKADGAGSSPVIVNVINNSNAQARTEQRQTSQGVELDVIIDNLVAEKMAKNGTASNSALKSFNNQSLVMR